MSTASSDEATGSTGAEPALRPLTVLVTFWNGGGNVPPHRALVRELLRRGHAVHVLTHDSLRATVEADGAIFEPLPTARQWDPSRPNSAEAEIDFIATGASGAPAYAADFLATVERLRPDVSVIDAMLITTLDAALSRGLPFAALNHLAWSADGRAQGFMSAITSALPGRADQDFLSLLEAAPLALATSWPPMGTTTAAPHVHFVGPIRESVDTAPWPRRFPDRPFVLVSLSTNFQDQKATLQAICDALAPLPLDVLVTTGKGLSPSELTLAGGVAAEAFVPHDRVLPHVDLTITHAGFGTLMFSAGAGVPCLSMPNGRDQDDNAERMAALGLGRTLPPDADPSLIATTVMAMLADDALKAACRAFAASVDRFGDLEGAARLVEGLARKS